MLPLPPVIEFHQAEAEDAKEAITDDDKGKKGDANEKVFLKVHDPLLLWGRASIAPGPRLVKIPLGKS
jgi:hypothetical protein